MKRISFWRDCPIRRLWVLVVLASLFGVLGPQVDADVIQMQNGDRYSGEIVSISRDTLLVQSEVLGSIKLPRGKVAQILLGTNEQQNVVNHPVSTNRADKGIATLQTNSSPEVSAVLRQLGAHTNLIRQVQSQFLAGAGTEANDKFNEMLSGLVSGSLSLNDLAVQARSAADQLRATRKELGEDGGMIDGYLSILDHFLKEVPAASVSSTNVAAGSTRPSPGLADE